MRQRLGKDLEQHNPKEVFSFGSSAVWAPQGPVRSFFFPFERIPSTRSRLKFRPRIVSQPEEDFFFWLKRGLGSTGASLAHFFLLERAPSTDRDRNPDRELISKNKHKLEQKVSATLVGDPVKRRYGHKFYESEFYTVLLKSTCYVAPFRRAAIHTIQTGQDILAQAAT